VGEVAVSVVKVEIKGLAELRNALLRFPEELQKGPLKHAVSQSAIVVRDAARARVPVLGETANYTAGQLRSILKRRKPGVLRNAIRVGFSKANSSRVQTSYSVFVKTLSRAARRKFKRGGGRSQDNPNDPWYWKVWEFGDGVNRSKSFLRPAFDTTHGRQLAVMEEKLREGIKRVEKKLSWSRPK
jgi:HK97 gp10 family phage protein